LPMVVKCLAVCIQRIQRGMLCDGVAYKRAGIALMDLARPQDLQGDMFSPAVDGNAAMMDTMELINRKFGSGSFEISASGWQQNPAWVMRHRTLSPCYTTRLSDLPRASC
jgi:DNA polymerase V